MEYESIILKDEITVRKVYTIHYFEYMKNFEFLRKVFHVILLIHQLQL